MLQTELNNLFKIQNLLRLRGVVVQELLDGKIRGIVDIVVNVELLDIIDKLAQR